MWCPVGESVDRGGVKDEKQMVLGEGGETTCWEGTVNVEIVTGW